jgi:hypothetical protein
MMSDKALAPDVRISIRAALIPRCRRLVGGLAAAVLAAGPACTIGGASPPGDTGYTYRFASTPISSIAVDDYASGATLTVPPGTEFALQLAGGGWTFPVPSKGGPVTLVRGPGEWFPDTVDLGPGNCDSASPCGGEGAVYDTSGTGYADVVAVNVTGQFSFDLHLVVKQAPIALDLIALPIPNEAFGTSVTMPLGSTVNVHLIGDWGTPQPNSIVNSSLVTQHIRTSGVVAQVGFGRTFDETAYSYSITGNGAYAYDFAYLDGDPYADGFTIGFDIT